MLEINDYKMDKLAKKIKIKCFATKLLKYIDLEGAGKEMLDKHQFNASVLEKCS